MCTRASLSVVCILLITASARAQTVWYVDDDNCPGPGKGTEADPFCKIQDGIDASGDGDEIMVALGTYTENINLLGKAVTVRSADPADPDTVAATIIDGNQDGSVFTFEQDETEDSVLDGLTIRNGLAELGGGIHCSGTQPLIKRCIITENTSTDRGGGLFGGGLTIDSCMISDNFAANRGGGIFIGSATVIDCLIMSNRAETHGGGGIYAHSSHGRIANTSLIANTAKFGGGMMSPFGSPEIINCLFAGNSATDLGGGLELSHSNATIINCTFTSNHAVTRGGGLYLNFGSPTVANSILWGNSAALGPQFHVHASGTPIISYGDMQGGQSGIGGEGDIDWGPGNIDVDPLFVDSGFWDDNGTPGIPDDDFWVEGDYHLLLGSPCIDAGNNFAVPEGIVTDLDGNPRFVDDPNTDDTGFGDPPIVDMGVFEFQGGCADEADCEDDNACTIDECIDALCVNTPIDCDDGDACTADSCELATGCVHDPLDCPDGEFCVGGDCVPVDSDGDGVPDVEDDCPESDLNPTIVIDDCETGVENQLLDDGCTMADLITQCAEDAVDHGAFVRCVSNLTNLWKCRKIINGGEKGAIMSCAAQSSLP